MLEVKGDIWKYPADAVVITTNLIVKDNGELVMGAGLAKQAKDRYPSLPYYFGTYYSQYANLGPSMKASFRLCYPYPGLDSDPTIIAFPTKYDWRDDSDLGLILNAARDLQEFANNNESLKTIVMPRPGCGLGKLDWDKVQAVIEPFLDDRFHIITPG